MLYSYHTIIAIWNKEPLYVWEFGFIKIIIDERLRRNEMALNWINGNYDSLQKDWHTYLAIDATWLNWLLPSLISCEPYHHICMKYALWDSHTAKNNFMESIIATGFNLNYTRLSKQVLKFDCRKALLDKSVIVATTFLTVPILAQFEAETWQIFRHYTA